MLRSIRLTVLSLLAILALAACSDAVADGAADASGPDGAASHLAAAEGVTVVVHRSESCECCGVYEDYLEDAGFTVEQVIHDDMQEVKARFGVPEGSWSCHTNEVAGYAAEGHVPAEALLRLLADDADIDGITLPGMPAGSPGMPGEQEAPFVVQTFVDGELVGELGSF
jgi:hypothetical protein